MSKHTRRQVKWFCFPTCVLLSCLSLQFVYYFLLTRGCHAIPSGRISSYEKRRVSLARTVQVPRNRGRRLVCHVSRMWQKAEHLLATPGSIRKPVDTYFSDSNAHIVTRENKPSQPHFVYVHDTLGVWPAYIVSPSTTANCASSP